MMEYMLSRGLMRLMGFGVGLALVVMFVGVAIPLISAVLILITIRGLHDGIARIVALGVAYWVFDVTGAYVTANLAPLGTSENMAYFAGIWLACLGCVWVVFFATGGTSADLRSPLRFRRETRPSSD